MSDDLNRAARWLGAKGEAEAASAAWAQKAGATPDTILEHATRARAFADASQWLEHRLFARPGAIGQARDAGVKRKPGGPSPTARGTSRA